MSGFGNGLAARVLDHLFGKATWTPPASFWLGVSTTAPNDDGTNVTEPADPNYARQEVTAASWSAAVEDDPSTISNAVIISFPFASESWGSLTHVVLYDSETGGEMVASGLLDAPTVVATGFELKFPITTMTVQLD